MEALDALLEDTGNDDALPRFTSRELIRQILPYYARYRRELALAVGLLLTIICLALLAPFLLGQIVDLATLAGGDASRRLLLPVAPDRSGLLVLAGAFVVIVLGTFLLEAWLGFVATRIGISMVLQLKEDLFRKILTLDPEFFRDYPPGRLIARVESDTESLKNLFSSTSLQLLRAALTFLGIFGCMAAFDLETTLIIVPLLLVFTLATAFFVSYVRRLYHLSRRYLAAITGHMTEYVQGIEVVQHHDYGPAAEASLHELQRERYRVDAKADVFNYGFWGAFAFGEIACVALVLWVGVDKIVAGTLTIGTVIVFVEYLRQVFMPIQLLSEFVAQIQRGFVAASRIFGILALTPRIADGPADAPVELGEGIRFEGVRFGYTAETEALRGVDFEVPAGKRVALVGASGGGKSTIVGLLLRYYDPSAGRITVGGQDLRDIPRSSWRRRLGLVPQEVFLFPGTLSENITVFDAARPPQDVERAVAIARAERLVARSPLGLDAQLSERGANLSHGERQLVSMARSLVHDPEVLVLDEATSSVDPHTEARIQESLGRALRGRTALIVAHRLSTVRDCDQILVVSGGEIVERGTHDELWERGGTYRDLAERQLSALGGPR